MNHLSIPGSDLTPSQLCLGTNRFGTVIPKSDSYALLDAFFSQGGNFVDTAHIYADWISDVPKSASEKTIGSWIKSRRNRDRVILATKGAHPHLESMHISRMSAV
jgi:aryl-alcohol dehydrogenase-like predicted oxidoreductase